jgi:hypothetical protein
MNAVFLSLFPSRVLWGLQVLARSYSTETPSTRCAAMIIFPPLDYCTRVTVATILFPFRRAVGIVGEVGAL